MEMSVFYEITAIIGVATAVGVLGTLLRQPLVVSFIAVGILVGPSGLGLATDFEQMQLLAQMGIALLLFVVGLKLDLHMIRTMGPVALATGLGQVVFTSIFGFLIARILGMAMIPSIYVAVALTFSSTIIVVKLLSDKREIDALHGRIAVGFLIVQDIVVVLVMIVLSSMGAVGDSPGQPGQLFEPLLWVVAKGLLFLAGIALMMTAVLPRLLAYIARSNELLLLFAVAWAVCLAAIGDIMGFSKEVGAFIAGVSLASTPYREGISSRLVSLRDFLLLFFFIHLGSQLDLSLLGAQVSNALIFSVFILIGNPLIVMIIMGVMGYRKRTGFLAGLTVAQISEFSLILAALGLSLGHIGDEVVGLITIVGLVTIGLSTYMIIYSAPLYAWLSPLLSIFEKKIPYRESASGNIEELPHVDVILFGLGNYGRAVSQHLLEHGKKLVGVDFDPEVLTHSSVEGLSVLYGDAGDPELFERLPLQNARWVMSAMPDLESNLTLLKAVRERGFEGRVVLSARNEEDSRSMEREGADLVLRPFVDAAEQAADALSNAMDTVTKTTPWPVDILEVRLRPGSMFAGRTISEIPLRSETGVSIMAVSRAGGSHFDPEPDFRLQIGDRLVLLGEPENLDRAAAYLDQRQFGQEGGEHAAFAVSELIIPDDSPWVGQTLGAMDFRRNYGVTLIGIERRGQRRITAPTAQEVLEPGDRVFVAGTSDAVGTCELSCLPSENPRGPA
jgi:Kef-type K+ transport system membrane component KefB/Trk K+ transport system NAD-binding subunit